MVYNSSVKEQTDRQINWIHKHLFNFAGNCQKENKCKSEHAKFLLLQSTNERTNEMNCIALYIESPLKKDTSYSKFFYVYFEENIK